MKYRKATHLDSAGWHFESNGTVTGRRRLMRDRFRDVVAAIRVTGTAVL